jgi:hypothetical protein
MILAMSVIARSTKSRAVAGVRHHRDAEGWLDANRYIDIEHLLQARGSLLALKPVGTPQHPAPRPPSIKMGVKPSNDFERRS